MLASRLGFFSLQMAKMSSFGKKTERKKVEKEEMDPGAGKHSLLPSSAAPVPPAPPGDSDLHGQRRCDIIYDIYIIYWIH